MLKVTVKFEPVSQERVDGEEPAEHGVLQITEVNNAGKAVKGGVALTLASPGDWQEVVIGDDNQLVLVEVPKAEPDLDA